MQCVCAMLSSVTCPASQISSTLSFKLHDFRKKFLNIKGVFWSSLEFWEVFFSFLEELIQIWSKICIDLRVKYPLFPPDWMNIEVSQHFFFSKKYSNIKFHENPSSESRDAPCAFYNFANAPKYSRQHLRTDLCTSPFSFFLHTIHLRPKICPHSTQTLHSSYASLSYCFADFSCKISNQPLCSKCIWHLAYCITFPCLCWFVFGAIDPSGPGPPHSRGF